MKESELPQQILTYVVSSLPEISVNPPARHLQHSNGCDSLHTLSFQETLCLMWFSMKDTFYYIESPGNWQLGLMHTELPIKWSI